MATELTVRRVERRIFKYGNKLMVPLLRSPLGRFMGSPPGGYVFLLCTTGWKSGLARYTPLNYAISAGCVYCLSGFGEESNWLANLRHEPLVRVMLPGRRFTGLASTVADPDEARSLALQVARNSGFALVFEDPRCLLMSDEQLAARLDGRPVVRIEPLDGPVVGGAYDPGGYGWVIVVLAQLLGLAGLRAIARRATRVQHVEAAPALQAGYEPGATGAE